MEMQLVGFTQHEAALSLKASCQTTLHVPCLFVGVGGTTDGPLSQICPDFQKQYQFSSPFILQLSVTGNGSHKQLPLSWMCSPRIMKVCFPLKLFVGGAGNPQEDNKDEITRRVTSHKEIDYSAERQ